jgi:hypothetical protein
MKPLGNAREAGCACARVDGARSAIQELFGQSAMDAMGNKILATVVELSLSDPIRRSGRDPSRANRGVVLSQNLVSANRRKKIAAGAADRKNLGRQETVV